MPALSRPIAALARNACLALVVATSPVASVSAQAESASGSIAYDKLDLATPDAALRTFLAAYRDGDYVTCYWIFSPSTQLEWYKRLAQFNLNSLVKNFNFDDKEAVNDLFPPQDKMDQSDNSFLFAHMMAAAKPRGMLPLDVAGLPADLSRENVPQLGKKTQTTAGDIDITVILKNAPAGVVFRMRLASTGRWRLLQIIPPGGDEKSIPFGLPDK